MIDKFHDHQIQSKLLDKLLDLTNSLTCIIAKARAIVSVEAKLGLEVGVQTIPK